MINTQGKLLISAFIVILLGIIFIQAVANDIDLVNTASYPATNETLTFINATTLISNETITLSSIDTSTGSFANDDLTAFYELRNETSEIITSFCNITLSSATLSCNATGSLTAYVNYTYVSGKTETLAHDDLTAVTALRNVTSEDILGYCNVTLSLGTMVCNNTHSGVGYADYTYESDTPYVRSSTTRTILTIIIIFFAIGILAVGIGYAWKALKDSSIM